MIPASAEKYIYYQEKDIVLLHGDCLEILPLLAPDSIQCCVTSPPYWGLRDYGADGQIGLEDTPDAYTERMSEVFAGVSKALRPDGTLWLNLGDSYAGSWGDSGARPELDNGSGGQRSKETEHFTRGTGTRERPPGSYKIPGLKPKDLVGIPWRVAFALQADGWYLRSDIIWHKPNPMPESVTDRPTKAHEYIFLMSKSGKYYYDHEAIKEPSSWKDDRIRDRDSTKLNNCPGRTRMGGLTKNNYETRNRRSVWTVQTRPFKGAHFAVFPPELIEPCILAGTKEGDIVIDPFGGSQTVGYICKKHSRRYIGIDIKAEYLDLGPERIGRQELLI